MSADCTALDRLRGPKILDMSIFDWVTSLAAAALVGWLLRLDGLVQWILFIMDSVRCGDTLRFRCRDHVWILSGAKQEAFTKQALLTLEVPARFPRRVTVQKYEEIVLLGRHG
jgi:hypothetical protein